MIDTHCHLTFPDFRDRVPEVLAEAADAGVTGLITISTTSVDCEHALTIARAHDRVWCSAGVHPLYADKGPHDWARITRVADDPNCVAWGELGLDRHYNDPPFDLQVAVLEEQIEVIRGTTGRPASLPIILHCREAFADLIPRLEATRLDPARFVFHCFTAGPDEARQCLDFGAMISFTGVVTYPNAREVAAAAALVPADRILIETDAPFLSPVPYRGKRPCRPAWVRHTAEFLAHAKGIAFDDFHRIVNDNTARFFGIDAR